MATLKIKNEQGIFEKVPFIIGGITQTDLDDIKKDFLPLTGGTLTGNITINNTYPVTNFIQERNKVRLINDNDAFWIEGTYNNAEQPTSRLRFDLAQGELFINNSNSRVYHENYKPSALDIGAVPRDTNGYTHQPLYIDSVGNIGQVQLICGNYGFGIRNDGVDTYFMLTDPGDPYGSWNNLRPIVINNASGRVNITGNITGNANTVDELHGWQMGVLEEDDKFYGASRYMYCKYNLFKDGRYGLGINGFKIRVDYATNCDQLNGLSTRNIYRDSPYIPYTGALPMDIGQKIDFHTSGSTTDFDGRLYIDATANGAGLCYESYYNSNYNMNITQEILNLKQSVANLLQAIQKSL